MIAYSSNDAVEVSTGSGRLVKRVNAGAAVVIPGAVALLIAGPATGQANLASEPFVVSLDGAISGSITVLLTFSGVSVTATASSLTLSPGSPTSSVVVTPATTGTLTVTASAVGYESASASYVLTSVAPDPDFTDWSYKLDPSIAFGTSHGTSPYYPGVTIAPKCNIEVEGSPTATDRDINDYKLNSAIGTYTGAAGEPSYGVTVTTTQIQKGAVTPTYPIVERITDPAGGGFWCYRHKHKRTEHYADVHKVRSQFDHNGDAVKHPWGTTLWHACAVYMTEDQVLSSPRQWSMLYQLQQGSSSLLAGGPFEIFINGGNGNPSAATIVANVLHYRNPNWLSGDYSNAATYIKTVQSVPFVNPVEGRWYYFITQSKQGCGYSDPNHGAIYGTLGEYSGGTDDGSEYFVRFWYAVDDGYPIAAMPEWRGHWGGPHNPLHVRASNNILVDGVLTNMADAVALTGFYHRSDYLPSTLTDPDVRTMIHRGVKCWVHQDGMDQIKVLNAFRT